MPPWGCFLGIFALCTSGDFARYLAKELNTFPGQQSACCFSSLARQVLKAAVLEWMPVAAKWDPHFSKLNRLVRGYDYAWYTSDVADAPWSLPFNAKFKIFQGPRCCWRLFDRAWMEETPGATWRTQHVPHGCQNAFPMYTGCFVLRWGLTQLGATTWHNLAWAILRGLMQLVPYLNLFAFAREDAPHVCSLLPSWAWGMSVWEIDSSQHHGCKGFAKVCHGVCGCVLSVLHSLINTYYRFIYLL